MSDLDSFFSEIKQIDTESINEDERPTKLRKIDGETIIGAALPSHTTISIVAAAKPSSALNENLSLSHDQNETNKTLSIQEKAELYNLMLEGNIGSTKSTTGNINSGTSNSNLKLSVVPSASNTTNTLAPPQFVPATGKKFLRAGGGEVWVDNTLNEWPANDYRIWVGDITKETTVEHLNKHFSIYPSFAKAKVIHSKKEAKARGYGFVSFLDPLDCAKALREQNGKYLNNRPMSLKRAELDNRDFHVVKKQEKKEKKMLQSLGL